jgi:hypothetical protein
MMLRSLVDEVVRRRLWPIPLVAILIAVAAPVLFMKPTPAATTADTGQPPAAAAGKLPGNAERLVATSDKAVTPHKRTHRKGQDPFAPPASAVAKADTQPAASGTAVAPPASSSSSGTVVVRNTDGSAATSSKATKTTAKKVKKPVAKKPAPKSTPTPVAPTQTVTYVDVRFARRMNSSVRHSVPRLQAFRAGGRVAAMFVHYSATRHVAVFAIAPSTVVRGPVKCREVAGVCRYVDIPEGSYARLTVRAADGSVRSRRLDVVSVREVPLAGNEPPATSATTLDTATCLLKGLLQLPANLPSIASNACD